MATFLSALDLFNIGPGPSSSHTLGPMRAAKTFVGRLHDSGLLARTASIQVELFGSLGATGPGHGTLGAVVLGLTGVDPETVTGEDGENALLDASGSGHLFVQGGHPVQFDPYQDIILRPDRQLPQHPNGLRFQSRDRDRRLLLQSDFYSIGGGFVVDPAVADEPDDSNVPYLFTTAEEMLRWTRRTGLSISQVTLANEESLRPRDEVMAYLARMWAAMSVCVTAGLSTSGVLPGGLLVQRRAHGVAAQLGTDPTSAAEKDALQWVAAFAMAVNEENAAGHTVVTAPTNGAAGVIPAVLHYCHYFVSRLDRDRMTRFLLTAGAIGTLVKRNASISGAEVGCQGEVGAACAMAAAGLTELFGGTPAQVENAAEIALEHHLGMTCDPVAGLVQIPCIERNAVGAVKAITAARMAMLGDGSHRVSLDTAIAAMRSTGADMSDKYKETARGGLALHVVQC